MAKIWQRNIAMHEAAGREKVAISICESEKQRKSAKSDKEIGKSAYLMAI